MEGNVLEPCNNDPSDEDWFVKDILTEEQIDKIVEYEVRIMEVMLKTMEKMDVAWMNPYST